jgi:hypothetical protein
LIRARIYSLISLHPVLILIIIIIILRVMP